MSENSLPAPSRESGVSAVEFAIVLPLLLLFVFGLIEFSRGIWIQTTLDYAVQQAARCAAVDQVTCGTVVNIQNYAASRAPGLSISNPTSTFQVTSPRPACGAEVTASLPFDWLVHNLLPYTTTLTARACFPV